jgi:nucleotide-binding universal stress UspA family protein
MKRILVCLDASPRAPGVLAAAADLAQRTGAKLSLLRAVGIPPELHKIVSVQLGADVIETLDTKAREELELLAQDVPKQLIEGLHVHVGAPWDTICREAKVIDVDVVVLGSHGYGGMDRVLGTTAAKVVNHCDRSVFVVRARPTEAT